ncbi:hypothetical protein [Profundibacterium mesophilum]|uniref:1,4-alpha-glucan branching enzyme n=1 Tax=Profundibacterium mesophilum KAUST100406-0324 TaxID=1037889 RepID=A0A921NPV9_9RHOB|nr:hypothetical protein [Profundibacterium mesophilum]KAF0675020.1 hypothetical protein PMES_02729 [Profundibacterium mesophilum KAUST100406-0324]
MSETQSTRDHETIRAWAEERDGRPAKIETSGEGGILRIDFRDPDDRMTVIEWEEFFEIFDESDLDFLYQEKTEDGGTSRFNKFVSAS